jgi:hypothetical protein
MRGYSDYLLQVFTDCMGLFLFSYVSELLYIHSKVMIVDDRRVIVTLSFLYVTNSSIVLTLDHRWDRRTSTNVVKRYGYKDTLVSWFLILPTSG